MIKNAHLVYKLEAKYMRKNKRAYRENLVIFEALWKQAQETGCFPSKNPLEGIETKIRIAKILNHPQLRHHV